MIQFGSIWKCTEIFQGIADLHSANLFALDSVFSTILKIKLCSMFEN
jgi:hypothetical protein